MGIYITGDTHGDIGRFSDICSENDLSEHDKLLICGDFGFIWYNSNDHTGKKSDILRLDELSMKPYEILFIDGNHENFNELYSYPEIEKYGAPVHKIHDNIYHLERGRTYTIEEKTIFTFGGAYSVDKAYRTQDISWWPQELPNDEEYKRAIESLKTVGNKVDYVITHTCPGEIVKLMLHKIPSPEEYELNGFFDWIMHETEFKQWYFGHWHTDESKSFNLHGKNKVFNALFYDVKQV